MSECLAVISLLFEADEITKADTQDKNVADSIAVYQSNDKECRWCITNAFKRF